MMENLIKPRKTEKALVRVRIRDIKANPYQPRTIFDETAIDQLALSIKENGLISPLTLRRLDGGGYALIAGERRLRALKKLGKNWADAVVMEADEAESRAMSLIENIQRENLTFFEEARAVRDLLRATGQTQDAVARKLGHSPSFVANRLRLLRLPDDVQKIIMEGSLSERHARALLVLENALDKLRMAAEEAAKKGLNVKQTEALVAAYQKEMERPKRKLKTVIRDQRMFVNAIKDTVKRLTDSGVSVNYRVEEDDDAVNVIVSLPKKAN